MGCRQYTPSSNATTLESKKSVEQYEDEDAHLYVQPPQGMTAEDVERLELTVGERCNEILLDTGLFIVSAVSG